MADEKKSLPRPRATITMEFMIPADGPRQSTRHIDYIRQREDETDEAFIGRAGVILENLRRQTYT